ncbi:fatty acid-2 hydroxylase [Phellopilus nigrolimitatus]|nr:fatty acid-2 hydroxylase [Phellopilus nigrolimitatus]
MSTMSKRVRIYTAEDLAAHNSRSSCWVARNGKVYDVSGFLADHPGGDDLILDHAGKDVGAVMGNKDEHEHSDSAYEMLDEFIVGRLCEGETIVSDDWVAEENFHPEDTNSLEDFEKNQFIDLRKPLIRQVWEANFSKAYYLKQVHQPRHLAEPARFFGPSYLEVFTRTQWYLVPLIWLPIAFNLFWRGVVGFSRPLPSFISAPLYPYTAASVSYTLHRFLFHIDDVMPDRQWAFVLHFLLHGVHHYLPMDRLRLVMPPLMFTALSVPFTRLAYMLFPTAVANGIISGSYTFYHFKSFLSNFNTSLHHTSLPLYMREMKKYHLAHHYKNFELGFGVTSGFF